MILRIRNWFEETSAAEWALIIVVVVGYLVGLLSAWGDFNSAELLVTFVLATVYLLLGRAAEEFFETYPGSLTKFGFFALEISLALVIVLILGPGAWLITLPLAVMAVSYLEQWWEQWLVHLSILFMVGLPFLLDGQWQGALLMSTSLVPAIFFIIVFMRLANSEQEARLGAEALAQDLEAANVQLAAYSTQVAELARTRERNRLAREIHDNLGHYLTVVNVQIRAAQAIMESDPQKASKSLQKAQRLTQEGLDAVRQSVAALRESPLGGRSLAEALAGLADEMESSGIGVTVDVQGEERPLDPREALTLYRVAQEGLTNVRKHAEAGQVWITLAFENNGTRLMIEDDGVGMGDSPDNGYGLLGIQERVELLDGQMVVENKDGGGFRLQVWLPVVLESEMFVEKL